MKKRKRKRKKLVMRSGPIRIVSSKIRAEVQSKKNLLNGIYIVCPHGSGDVKGRGLIGTKKPALSCYLHSKGMVLREDSLEHPMYEKECLGCDAWELQADIAMRARERTKRKKIELKQKRRKISWQQERRLIPTERRKIPLRKRLPV